MGAPKFEITARDVIRFFRKEYRMKVSEPDAREWLEFWGDTFAYELKVLATPHVENMFRHATFRNFPDKAFTRFYKRVDQAIADAYDEYATGLGLEIREHSDTELERCQMIKYLMSRPRHKREAIIWQNAILVPVDAPIDTGINEPFRAHVIVDRRKITARIIAPQENDPLRVRIFGSKPVIQKKVRKPRKRPAAKYSLTVH